MNPIVQFLRAMAGKIVVPRMEAKLRAFERALHDAPRTQRKILFEKIRRCQSSQFGKDHRFHEIRTIEDFRRNIPIAQYDYYYPYVERVTRGDVEAMFPPGEKLLMFTLSSGTTDAPKLIPVNKIWMNEYRNGWQVWGVKAFLDHHALFYSKLTGIAGNWDMRRTPTNLPCGMASGLSARMQSPLLRMMYCVPPSVYEIDDPAAKYYAAARLSIAANAGLFMTATPATVVSFAKIGDRYREALIRDIRDGTLSKEFEIPQAIRNDCEKRIAGPLPERAKDLEAIVERTGHLYPRDYWNLSLVACWLGGTVGSYARHISDYYGDVARRDIGLLCSEGRFTIPLVDGLPSGVLEVASHYYEFIPKDEIDSPQPTVLECHELEEGKEYFILLTTSNGLYRYNIYDVMKCVGFVGQTPILEFLNKGGRIADMEGEKVSEHHLVQAVSTSADRLGMTVTGFTAVPVRPPTPANVGEPVEAPYYALMLEEQDVADRAQAIAFLDGVDRWLADNNVMYQGKRSDGYIGAPRLIRVAKGAWAQFDQEEIRRRRVSEDHYKHPCLVLDESFLGRFGAIEEIRPEPGASAAGR